MREVYKVLLYYKYVAIEDTESLRLRQRELCERLNLRGRIIIADEGINGTVAGIEKNVNEYMEETRKYAGLFDLEFKVSDADKQVFPRLRILVRDEIVTLGIKDAGQKAEYIEPDELLEMYEHKKDFVIIDARNLYEAEIGKFKNAVVAPINNFREFPKFVKKMAKYKNREVITYCTGGVRCEKASALLIQNGFKNVKQLHGGIHEYGEKVGGKYFDGEMFVFDDRLHVPVNKINPEVITKCIYCDQSIARYIDCSVKSCDSLFICCEECQINYNGTCSTGCLSKL